MEKKTIKNKNNRWIYGIAFAVIALIAVILAVIGINNAKINSLEASAASSYSQTSIAATYANARYYNKSAYRVYQNDTLTYTAKTTTTNYYYYVNSSGYFYYGQTAPTTSTIKGAVIGYGNFSTSYPIYGFRYIYSSAGALTVQAYSSASLALRTIYTSSSGWSAAYGTYYRNFQINNVSAYDTSVTGYCYAWINVMNNLNASTNTNTITLTGVNCSPSSSSISVATTGATTSVTFTPIAGYTSLSPSISVSSSIAGTVSYTVTSQLASHFTVQFTGAYEDVTFTVTMSGEVELVITPDIQNAVMQGDKSKTYTFDDFPISVSFKANGGYSFAGYEIEYTFTYTTDSVAVEWTKSPEYLVSDDGKYLYITMYSPVYSVDNITISGSPESAPYTITSNVWGGSASSSNVSDIDGGSVYAEAITLEYTAFSNMYLSFDEDTGELENWTVENASYSISYSDDKTVIYVKIWNATDDVVINGSFVVLGKGTAQAAAAFTVFVTPCIEFMTAPLLGGYSFIDVLSVPLFIGLALIFIKLFAGG